MSRTALVIGAGPAGLMAAEVLGEAGLAVTVADRMPSVGRKFLMAGKSGLNLTMEEPGAAFAARYPDAHPTLIRALESFGPAQVKGWAEGLGQPLFTGSTGRVFPRAMKASPLLRAWLARLDGFGVERRTRWRWTGWDGEAATFETPKGPRRVKADLTVLALGGGSWARLGSDGLWVGIFADAVAPFQPSNGGFRVAWSDHMEPHLGQPVKATELHSGHLSSRGEWVLGRGRIEGGGIYALSRALRQGAALTVDLLPDLSLEEVSTRLARASRKATATALLRKTLALPPVKLALFNELARGTPRANLAATLKALPVPVAGPLPLDQAISTAGGLRWQALDGFGLRARPGWFAAGEMLDWDAPTGGYLLTASLATGRAAARQALERRR
ncbi:TIGR03862 family flavoprotein [Salipiger sp. IMCC34102]|uniref:TIGR03862 family flavoprotein n=1 Tax=Salipiger sp. IMCC34102 TaxID=2510647 RepID=UPI00101C7473|nr:TIGR03862 family flavoprotein [Salipiger sp. IMCC34102]RYH04026.1 TIGR03862 family flavoprotein [Salipiger sp. IMCC34102]